MRGLLMVDLDNVLKGRPRGAELDGFARAAVKRVARFSETLGLDACQVAIAFNTDTASRYSLGFEQLRDAGRQLGKALGATVEIELALALTMPQTADVLIERLARESPAAEGAGPYHAALVFTKDQGLIDSLDTAIYRGGRLERSPWIQITDSRELGTIWGTSSDGPAVIRKPPKSAEKPGNGRAPSVDEHVVAVRGGRAVAAWAASRPIDIRPESDLDELAAEIDENPWVLSQVGPTTHALRGITRMKNLPAVETPVLGRVSSKDGVEVLGKSPKPLEVAGAVAATVGIGAARFKKSKSTLASKLPTHVLAKCEGPLLVDRRGGVNTTCALQKLRTGEGVGLTAKVRLSHRGGWLLAQVEHSLGVQPKCWWMIGETTLKSHRRIDGAGAMVPSDIVATGVTMRSPWRELARVSLRAPDDERVISVSTPVAQGTIGQGWIRDQNGLDRGVAILARQRAIGSGEEIVARAIHTCPRTGSLARFPAELWSLPVMVAS